MTRLFALMALVPAVALSQAATTNVSGTVRDAEGRPLSNAVVALTNGSDESSMRTDDAGEFAIRNVRVGNYALTVRRLGYEPYRQGIDVVIRTPPLAISLVRLATLDTVRIKSKVQAIYGGVGTAKELKPVTSAIVQVIGMTTQYNVDSLAHFYIPIKNAGSYMVRVKADGFEPQMFSVTVPKNQAVEVAPLLDPSGGKTRNMEIALADFAERARYRNPQRSAIISHAELMADGDLSMLGAIRGSKPFVAKSLRFVETICIYVDGIARPNVSLNSLDPRDYEAIEVYAEVPATLKWPKAVPCSETGMPQSYNISALSQNSAQFVVLWTRR